MSKGVAIEEKYPAKLRAKVLAAYQAGGDLRGVCQKYGVKIYTVTEIARRAGILRPRKHHEQKPPSKFQIAQIALATRIAARTPPNSKNAVRTARRAAKRMVDRPLKSPAEENTALNDVIHQIDEAIAVIIAARIVKALEVIRDH